VLAHHMQDLKDVTSHTHYENYRTGKLTAMMKSGEEEGNALTAVGDEIRSRSAAAKKEATKTEQVEKKVELSSTKIVLNKEPTEQQAPAVKERHESEKVRQLRRGLLEEQEREQENRESRSSSATGFVERKAWESGSSGLSSFLGRSTESLDKKKKYGLPARPFKFGRS